MAKAKDIQPWERQPGETRRAFAAFCHYRDMGVKRSTRRVADELTISDTLARRWSARWAWVARSGAWDEEQDRQARAAQLDAIKEMNARQAKIGHAAQAVIQHRLNEWMKAIQENKGVSLSALEMARLLEAAVKVERLARGEPTDVQKQAAGEGGFADVARRILGDPEAVQIAAALAARVAGPHASDAGGVCPPDEQGAVAGGAPPAAPEPPAR